MKTYRHLYPQIYTFGNLHRAYRAARKGKRGRVAVASFEFDMESQLLQLQRELQEQTYCPGAYTSFYIHEPKRRLVSAAPFRDRVVHHALCNVIEPIWEARFIPTSYACRVGKGTHAALDQCERWTRQYRYAFHGDIVKYFPSIDLEILRGLLARRIADRQTLWLIDRILESGADIQRGEAPGIYFPGDRCVAESPGRFLKGQVLWVYGRRASAAREDSRSVPGQAGLRFDQRCCCSTLCGRCMRESRTFDAQGRALSTAPR